MKRILDILYALTHPIHWVRNYPACKYYDKWLHSVIENDSILRLTDCRAFTKDKVIWIENYPYAYSKLNDVMVYRRTVGKFKKYIDKKRAEEFYGKD
jgi:hypothetical protein